MHLAEPGFVAQPADMAVPLRALGSLDNDEQWIMSSALTYPKLNHSFDFLHMFRTKADLNSTYSNFVPNIVAVQIPSVSDFVRRYQFLSSTQLQHLCHLHGIHVGHLRAKLPLQLRLLRHACSGECSQSLYVFKSLDRQRRIGSVLPSYSLSENSIQSVLDDRRQKNKESEQARRKLKKALRVIRKSRSRSSSPVAGPSFSASSNEGASVQHQQGQSEGAVADTERDDAPTDQNTPASEDAVERESDDFPFFANDHLKRSIISDWQKEMQFDKWKPVACAVCGQRRRADSIKVIHADDIDLSLLTNPHLPQCMLPTAYNLDAYEGAILHPRGIHDCVNRGRINVCNTCEGSLLRSSPRKQPVDALANFQYYGFQALPNDVRECFEQASHSDLKLVARARCSRVTHLFVKNKSSPVYGGNPASSQRYNRGNVAVVPQDTTSLRDVLPPSSDDIQQSLCALFVGGRTKPSRQNIAKLGPVMVSKRRVRTIIQFLTTKNEWYRKAHTTFSPENLENLYDSSPDNDDHEPQECGVLKAVEIGHLPSSDETEDAMSPLTATSDYTDRNVYNVRDMENSEELLMEAVGYGSVSSASQQYRSMKANALAWCLDKKKILKRSRFVSINE